jgi:hypothetical protein
MIMRVFRLAAAVPVLFVAAVGVSLMPLGWSCADTAFLTDADRMGPLSDVIAANRSRPGKAWDRDQTLRTDLSIPNGFTSFLSPMLRTFTRAVEPFLHLVRRDLTAGQAGYFATGAVWNLLVWALCGGVITRIAVMRLGREEPEGLVGAVRFVARRFFSFFAAPLFPLLGVGLVVLFASVAGWCFNTETGVVIASLIWIFVLFGGLVAAVLLLGLLFGWPLMWGALAAEEMGDVLEASQRAYSFTFGKPLHYAFYAAVALVYGSLSFLLVYLFAESVVYLSDWSASRFWGTRSLADVQASGSAAQAVGVVIIHALNNLVLTAGSAFRYSFFWCSAGAIYLLLRCDNDQTEYDDVYVPDTREQPPLPPAGEDTPGDSPA